MSPALLCLVVAIADGDTLTARCGDHGASEQVKVRISAIDAPEKRQDFGERSRQALAALCFHQAARITEKTRDRYGRTVADVECQGQDAGRTLVAAGMAWYFVKYGRGYEHLADIEADARAARRGLWSMPAVAPWEWRRSSR